MAFLVGGIKCYSAERLGDRWGGIVGIETQGPMPEFAEGI